MGKLHAVPKTMGQANFWFQDVPMLHVDLLQAKGEGIMLKVLNDFVLVKPDPVEAQVDNRTGLTTDVVNAIKNSKLVIPDIAQYALKKYPMTGKVITKGPEVSSEIKIGQKVLFGYACYAKFEYEKTEYFSMREKDIICVFTSN